MEHASSFFETSTIGVSRRSFLKLAAVAGVSLAGGMLVFPDQRADAAFSPAPGQAWPALQDGHVRFTVHSDTHVGAEARNSYAQKIPAAFSGIYAAAPDVTAHFFVGDSADTGTPAQYDELASLLNANARKPVGIVMGNHEYYSWQGNKENAQAAFKEFLFSKLAVAGSFQIPGGANEGQTDCDFIVGGSGGYHVLALSSHPGGYDNSWYGDRQDWIRERLAAAQAEDANKPIFMLTHHPFGNTVWYSTGGSWNGQFGTNKSDRTGNDMAFYHEIAAAYPQIVHFSGHTHIPMADPRSIYQDDGCTLIQTATFANNFWTKGGQDEGYNNGDYSGGSLLYGHPADGDDANQCELVDIDPATHVVTVYRMDFREGACLGEPWSFSPNDQSTKVYTSAAMEARSLPPTVEADAAVRVPNDDTLTSSGAYFAITANKVHADATGLDNDIVLCYRVEVFEADSDTPLYDARFMSEYYKASQNRADEFVRPLIGAALAESTAYTLKAYARNAYGKEALIGQTEFRTKEREVTPLEDPLLSVDFAQGSADDLSAAPHALKEFGALELTSDPLFNKQVGVFGGAAAAAYAFTSEDYARIGTGCTLEVLFRFDEEPSSYFELFSSGQSRGQNLEYYPSSSSDPNGSRPSLHYYTSPEGGGWKSTSAYVDTLAWTHVVATYDGVEMKLYANGTLASQFANPGTLPPPSVSGGAPLRWFLGADTNAQGEPEHAMVGRVAFARLSPGVATEDHVATLYAASAVPASPIQAPTASDLGKATVGEPYAIPSVSFEDVNGSTMQATPFVTDPDGNPVALENVEAQKATGSTEGSAPTWQFTPAAAGTYTLAYAAGYASATTTLTAAFAPEKPGNDSEPGGGSGSGGSGQDGSGTGGSGTGSGSGGSSGTGNGSGGSTTIGNPAKTVRTGDASWGAVAGAAAIAALGALGGAAAKLKKGEEEDD